MLIIEKETRFPPFSLTFLGVTNFVIVMFDDKLYKYMKYYFGNTKYSTSSYLHTARSCINYVTAGDLLGIALAHSGPRGGERSTVLGWIRLLFSNSLRCSFTSESMWKVLRMGPTALRDLRTTEQLEQSVLSRDTKSQPAWVGLEPGTLSTKVQCGNRSAMLPYMQRFINFWCWYKS